MVNDDLADIRDLIRRSSLGGLIEGHSSAKSIDAVIARADEVVVEARSMGIAEHDNLVDSGLPFERRDYLAEDDFDGIDRHTCQTDQLRFSPPQGVLSHNDSADSTLLASGYTYEDSVNHHSLSRRECDDHVILRSAAVFDLLAPRTPAVPVQVELRYDTRDPFAVVAAFRSGRASWVEWLFSRDLLADGLLTEAGEGDVRIRPACGEAEVVVVELISPSGHAMFEASTQQLAEFLDASYDVVLPGHESLWMNLDEAMSSLSFVMLTVDRDGPEGFNSPSEIDD